MFTDCIKFIKSVFLSFLPKKLTPRAIEEKIIDRMMTQPKAVRIHFPGKANLCGYRNKDGIGCAVGCVIPDKYYDPNMEDSSMYQVLPRQGKWEAKACKDSANAIALANALNATGIPATLEVKNMLSEWQARHDNPGNWTDDFRSYTGPLHSVLD